MKNGYILLTQVMMDLQRMRGRIIQVGQRLNGSRDGLVRAAADEIEDMPRIIMTAMDILVEVQGLMPEPTQGDIVGHYSPVDPKGAPITPPPPDPDPEVLKTVYNLLVDRQIEALIDDKRPAGWTEALALEFIAENAGKCGELDSFADLFLHGQWAEIQGDWPEFQTFINKQLEGGEEVVDEDGPVASLKPEHYDQWISSECMMLIKGLVLIDKAGNDTEIELPRDKLDLVGRILNDQRKRLTDALAKKLDKVVLPHAE